MHNYKNVGYTDVIIKNSRDIIVRGWDMHNGVDHVAADTSEETEH